MIVRIAGMSEFTKIQWADTTVNPIMGCSGCELFPTPAKVLATIDDYVEENTGTKIHSKLLYQELVDVVFSRTKEGFSHPSHKRVVNTTNIWHLKERFIERVSQDFGEKEATCAEVSVAQSVTCYAAVQHLNKSTNILNREGRLKRGRDGQLRPHKLNSGYATIFEAVTQFPGRSLKTADLDDLWKSERPTAPWKNGLPRLIFVSDMGDAFSAPKDMPYLEEDLMPAIGSENGSRHLWLWLTKRPDAMAKFAKEIGGFPPNVCAMTTLTGSDPASMGRLAEIKKVDARIRGLSIEPLWERIAASDLDLEGIDWVILGGESGSGDLTRPFDVEWAEELREHCRKQDVAFFMKQLGRNPMRGLLGEFRLKDKHGGDWAEWDESLRVRKFPNAFYDYRKGDDVRSTIKVKKVKKVVSKPVPDVLPPVIVDSDQEDFARLDAVVRRGARAFVECGTALAEIHDRELWKQIAGATWESYCREVIGMSKPHAHRLVEASKIAVELESLPIGNDLPKPISESQVRPLRRLNTAEQRARAWEIAYSKQDGQPTAREVLDAVVEVLAPELPAEPRQTKSQQRVEIFSRLKEVIKAQNSWEDVERMIAELEALV